jgi:hypothetical protein
MSEEHRLEIETIATSAAARGLSFDAAIRSAIERLKALQRAGASPLALVWHFEECFRVEEQRAAGSSRPEAAGP